MEGGGEKGEWRAVANLKGLRCRECGQEYPIGPVYFCEYCFGPLEVDYDYASIRKTISRESIAQGPSTMWRYRDLLPVGEGDPVDLGTGFTPLIKADNLARALGIRRVYLKNDAVNPTYSFKDRVVSVAVTRAIEFGFDTIACASTGNLACSVAAHAAKAGLNCYILIPSDLERGKVVGTAIYHPHLVAVRGNYDEVNRLSTEIAEKYGWAFVNINVRPFYSEGSKSLAYETAEQLGWRAPDHVVVPIGGGSLLTKIRKGFQELEKLGLIDEARTRISGAQPAGCAPVADAFREGRDNLLPVKPRTIAKSLAIGNPADGYYALDTIRRSGGAAAGVTDEEIVQGIELLAATEGIFTEPAGGVTVATARRLAQEGIIGKDELLVLYITGNGLKTIEAVQEAAGEPQVIDPSLSAFDQLHETLLARAS
ncbi:MAG: threonine synthase [Firmicutes bacterium]|nr:threonine synthase [Bacillota bacterium]